MIVSFTFSSQSKADEIDSDFARYRDFGHLSGLIGNYLTKPQTPVKMSTTTGSYRLTFYWITREVNSKGPKTKEIFIVSPETGEENPTVVSSEFKRHLDQEGTAILEDGRLINVIEHNEKKRYLDITMKYPTGLGSRNNTLTPFISVAVSDENSELKFGDRIYIPEVKGIPLPDGGKHDGLLSVDDTGKGLAKDQIDIFIFIKKNWQNFQSHLKNHEEKFFVYKVYPDSEKK
jgi:hypothetical protein